MPQTAATTYRIVPPHTMEVPYTATVPTESSKRISAHAVAAFLPPTTRSTTSSTGGAVYPITTPKRTNGPQIGAFTYFGTFLSGAK